MFVAIVNTNLIQLAMETHYCNICYMLSFIASYVCLFATIFGLDFSESKFVLDSIGGQNYMIFLVSITQTKLQVK